MNLIEKLTGWKDAERILPEAGNRWVQIRYRYLESKIRNAGPDFARHTASGWYDMEGRNIECPFGNDICKVYAWKKLPFPVKGSII